MTGVEGWSHNKEKAQSEGAGTTACLAESEHSSVSERYCSIRLFCSGIYPYCAE